MEEQGYDVTYISNTDLHRDAAQAKRGKGFLSVGHDEYWTIEMFNHMQSAITEGVNVGFFSGNAVCGRVEWDEATRSIRRVGVFGPPEGTREFSAMASLKHERPYANELIGAHSTGPVTGGADWICTLPEHWIYEGTGMKAGDSIPGVIGWEWHGDPADKAGLEIVAEGATQSAPGTLNDGHYTATIYPGPKGNFVFNASTCWWRMDCRRHPVTFGQVFTRRRKDRTLGNNRSPATSSIGCAARCHNLNSSDAYLLKTPLLNHVYH